MESSSLVTLSDEFYDSISMLLTNKKKEILTSGSILTIKEYENIKKIIVSIQNKREEKIVLLAVRGETNPIGLASSEKEMLKELSAIIKRTRDRIKNVWDNDDNLTGSSRRVKALTDVAQYKGLDEKIYGPFKSGEEYLLPLAEADWLLKAKMAELV